MTFEKFYRRPLDQRRKIIQAYLGEENNFDDLPADRADKMVENYLYNYHLPLGILPQIIVNQKTYRVPMVTEEPSVIAAASNGGKRLGNIQAWMEDKVIEGQIIMTGIGIEQGQQLLDQYYEQWMAFARSVSQDMVKRGGGPQKLSCRSHQVNSQTFVTFDLEFDPCDAMGANSINTVVEALAQQIEAVSQGQVLMAILSNFAPKSIASARVNLPLAQLDSNPAQADKLARKMAQASLYAQLDPYRAVTHNKGIMNGVDAVLLATGNDWRAVEAGIHAYATRDGQYRGLSQWIYDERAACLKGQLDLPLQIATVGGTLSVHPQAKWSLELLGISLAKELGQVIVAVGLAQNFAALRALVSEGIQKGHMALQAQSLAIQAGAQAHELDELTHMLQASENYSLPLAEALLDKLRKKLDNKA